MIDKARQMFRKSKTFFSNKKCELEGCDEPIGIVSLGQEKRFHSKTCRRKRHNITR